MRVSKEQVARNQARILREAARLFREKGFDGVGVDALSNAAGLTHGGLYSRFGSKEALTAAALAEALRASTIGRAAARVAEGEERGHVLSELIGRYLSPAHRDAVGQGCPLPALGCEMPRQGSKARQVFTDGIRIRIAHLAELVSADSGPEAEARATAILAGMVGALVLARAVDDPGLSDSILRATAQELGGERRGEQTGR